mgnify:CR=1 FL=1
MALAVQNPEEWDQRIQAYEEEQRQMMEEARAGVAAHERARFTPATQIIIKKLDVIIQKLNQLVASNARQYNPNSRRGGKRKTRKSRKKRRKGKTKRRRR